MTATISAQDFANQITDNHGGPCVFFTSVGSPAGRIIALLNETTLPFDPSDLDGTVDSNGQWQWDGQGDPTDERGNTVLRVTVLSNAAEYDRQHAEWMGE